MCSYNSKTVVENLNYHLVVLMALTQVLVVRSHIEHADLDPSLKLGSCQNLSDIPVVTDDNCVQRAKVETQYLSTVFLGQFMISYVSELEVV
jgi:hypothetical protein